MGTGRKEEQQPCTELYLVTKYYLAVNIHKLMIIIIESRSQAVTPVIYRYSTLI